MIKIGEYTGDGLVVGLENRFKQIKDTVKCIGGMMLPTIPAITGEVGSDLLGRTGAYLRAMPSDAHGHASGTTGQREISFAGAVFNWYGKDDIRKTAEELTRQMLREEAKLA